MALRIVAVVVIFVFLVGLPAVLPSALHGGFAQVALCVLFLAVMIVFDLRACYWYCCLVHVGAYVVMVDVAFIL